MNEAEDLLIGRTQEVAAIRALTAKARLTTVTGVGGVGKSAVLAHVARELQRADAVAFLDFDEEQLNWRQALAAAAKDTRWLCLDHVDAVDQAELAAALAQLLRGHADMAVLCAGRRALGVTAEQVFRLTPFNVPRADQPVAELLREPALQLFITRARSRVPRFGLEESNRDRLCQIVAAVGGLPLGLELAAQRLAVLDLDQLVERLDFVLDLLRQRGMSGRSSSLRQSALASYENCDDLEREVWRRLAIFPGSFTIDRAEDVCSDAGFDRWDVLDAVTGLIEKSVVERDDTTSQLVLLPAHRSLALELCLPEEIAAAETRLGRDLIGKAAAFRVDWMSPRQVDAVAQIRQVLGELTYFMDEAIQSSDRDVQTLGAQLLVDLTDFWFLEGRFQGPLRWGRGLISPASQVDPGLRLAVDRLVVLISIALAQENSAAGSPAPAAGPALAAGPERVIQLAWLEAAAGLWSGDPQGCVEILQNRIWVDAELAAATALSDVLQAHLVGSMAYRLMGNRESSLEQLQHVLRLSEGCGEGYFRSHAYWYLALDQLLLGQAEMAEELLRQAYDLKRPLGDRWGMWLVGEALVVTRLLRGDEVGARRLRTASLAMAVQAGMKRPPIQVVWLRDRVASLCREFGFDVTTMSPTPSGNGLDLLHQAINVVLGTDKEGASARGADADRAELDLGDSPLTKREREVVALIVEGLTNREIAARLVVSQKTAQGHVENILRKLGVRSRTQVAAWVASRRHDGS